jgi:hypothetical protein
MRMSYKVEEDKVLQQKHRGYYYYYQYPPPCDLQTSTIQLKTPN